MKLKNLLTITLIALFINAVNLQAQNTYSVTRVTNITYNTIGGSGSSVTWQITSADDNTSNDVTIPFAFSFMGSSYSKVRICTNGWLSFKATTLTTFSNNLSVNSAGLDSIIAPMWDDLVVKGNLAANLSTSIKYQTEGTAPNRVFIAEWIGMERFGQLGPNLNFQVRLYETSNVIETVYGTMDPANSSFTYSLGLRSNNTNYIAQQKHNTDYFTANTGGNVNLAITPLCNTKITYTPAATFSAGTNPPATAPVNDESTGAITLPVNIGTCTNSCNIFYVTENATASAGIATCSAATPGTPDDDVWFKFEATQSSTTVTVVGCAGYDPVVQFFDASLTSLNCVNANATSGGTETMNLTSLTVGNTYYIRVYHAAAGNGATSRISICVSVTPPTLANDDCSGAVSLTVGSGFCTNPVTGTLIGATASTGAPAFTCGSSTLTNDVWYKVLVTSGQTVTVQTSAVNGAAGNNMILQAIRSSNNTCGGSLSSKTCDDNNNNDPVSDLMSRITINNPGPADSTYFLRLIANENIDISDFAICAWNSGVTKPVATGSNCVDGTVTIDSAYKYTWVPLTDASGNIIAEIFPNGNKLGNTTYSYYINSGAIRTADGGKKYLDRNITITPATLPSTPVQVRLYYKSAELDLLQAVDPSVTSGNLNVTKTSNTCANSASTIAAGTFLPQAANGVYNTVDSFVTVNVSGFSTFFLHGGGTVITLPLKLINFSVSKQINGNVLQWKTSLETRLKHFELESSLDGGNFMKIATVMANGGSGFNNYRYTDGIVHSGKIYYRLKMVDIDGKYTYSNIIFINADGKNVLSVYPNPVRDILTLTVDKTLLNTEAVIIDTRGKVLQRVKITQLQEQISIEQYTSGMYIIKTANGSTMKILKQ